MGDQYDIIYGDIVLPFFFLALVSFSYLLNLEESHSSKINFKHGDL